jgi:hypothetical protein
VIEDAGIVYFNLPIYGDDLASPQDEGIAPGELFTLKLWDQYTGQVFLHGGAYEWQDTFGPPLPCCDDPNQVFVFTSDISGSQSLYAGWNLISPLVEESSTMVRDVFSDLIAADQLQYVTGFACGTGAQLFDPDLPDQLNTLADIVPGEGYWVKLSGNAEFAYSGQPIPTGYSVDLCANWNLIGYWLGQPNGTRPAFQQVIDAGSLFYVTGFEQGALLFDPILPDQINTLQVVKPGMGYWVKMASQQAGFVFPAPAAAKAGAVAAGTRATSAQTPTNRYMFVYGQVECGLGGCSPEQEFVVETETGAVLARGSLLEDGMIPIVPVYGDDPLTQQVEGPIDGDELVVRIRNEESAKRSVVFTGDMEPVKVQLRIEEQPLSFDLKPNYPNPFNPTTTIDFSIERHAPIDLSIFDMTGRLVRRWRYGQLEPGRHSVTWDARTSSGATAASGVYMVVLRQDKQVESRAMVLLK